MGKKNDKHYEETDIKEFIQRLKEEMPYEREFIDKLAGDKFQQ